MIDCSHASDEVLRQTVALSKAPIILSHSGMRAIHDHPRNVSDADALLVASKGGVIQVNAYSAYMVDAPAPNPGRDAATKDLMSGYMRMDTMTGAEKRALVAKRKAIEARFPAPRANFDMFMAHLLHAIKVVGIDHVGISGDFDGGGGVDGLDDITAYPKVTAALLKAGYSPADSARCGAVTRSACCARRRHWEIRPWCRSCRSRGRASEKKAFTFGPATGPLPRTAFPEISARAHRFEVDLIGDPSHGNGVLRADGGRRLRLVRARG